MRRMTPIMTGLGLALASLVGCAKLPHYAVDGPCPNCTITDRETGQPYTGDLDHPRDDRTLFGPESCLEVARQLARQHAGLPPGLPTVPLALAAAERVSQPNTGRERIYMRERRRDGV